MGEVKPAWQIGQTVYEATTIDHGPRRGEINLREGVITKVGSKWVYYGRGHLADRFNAVSGRIDSKGFASPGRVWVSREAFEAHQELKAAWKALRDAMGPYGDAPTGLLAADLRALVAKIEAARATENDDDD